MSAAGDQDRVLRAGVVGLGWAGQQHMAGFAAAENVELVALAGMEADQLARLGDEYGVEQRYGDAATMFADADLDVVSLATPTAMHAPMSIAALEAGVHVLSEKPMAESAEQARKMVAAARANDRVLEVMFNKRQGSQVRTISDLVSRGLLGRIYYAKAGWVRRHGIPGLGSWFTTKALAGGGPMMDLGIHALDMALHLMGEPEVATVSASTYAEFGPRGRGGAAGSAGRKFGAAAAGEQPRYEVEDLGTAFVRMNDGATLLLEASWAQAVQQERHYVEVYGTEGGAGMTISAAGTDLWATVDVDGIPAALNPRPTPHGGHIDCVADFVAHVRSGDWEAHRGDAGLKRTVIIDACYTSAEQGREVSL